MGSIIAEADGRQRRVRWDRDRRLVPCTDDPCDQRLDHATVGHDNGMLAVFDPICDRPERRFDTAEEIAEAFPALRVEVMGSEAFVLQLRGMGPYLRRATPRPTAHVELSPLWR